MKNVFLLPVIALLWAYLLIFSATGVRAQNTYSYTPEGKLFYTLSTERILVKFEDNYDGLNKGRLFKNIPELSDPEQWSEVGDHSLMIVEVDDVRKTGAIESLIEQLDDMPQVKWAHPFLRWQEEGEHSFTEDFSLGLKDSCDLTPLKKWVKDLSLEIINQDAYNSDIYHLRTTKVSPGNALEIANRLFETGEFRFVEPDFLFRMKPMTDDPLYYAQWPIANTGNWTNSTPGADMNVDQAWSEISGNANIVVAVLDNGVQLNHPDLVGNLVPGFDATGGGSNGAPTFNNDSHGTACAGLIAARANNNIGLAGIAFASKIMPIRIAYNQTSNGWTSSSSWVANGINWAWQNGADVLSNSYGLSVPSSIVNTAINNAVNQGRNGLGSPVLISAGNENRNNVSYPSSVARAIAVGATSPCDERKSPSSCDNVTSWGSNYGTGIDISAPGVFMVTTDLTGAGGSNASTDASTYPFSPDYMGFFSGTSAACPAAAAVMALILTENPSLTEPEARSIIEGTCAKVGGYNYNSSGGNPNGTWSSQLGYGRVDAYEAIRQAADAGGGGEAEIVLFAALTVDANPIIRNEEVTVEFNVLNSGDADFNGRFGVGLWDENGENGEVVASTPSYLLEPNHRFTDPRVFEITFSQPPGNYRLGAIYQPDTGGNWQIVGDGNFDSVMPVVISDGVMTTLTLSRSNITVAATTNSANFSVNSNCDNWTVSESSSWLSASPNAGGNNRTVNLTLQENPGTTSRSATITVSGCGITRTLTVTQEGQSATLNISSGDITQAANDPTNTMTVVSNCSNWSISEAASWLSVSPSNGSGNRTINLTFQANTSTESRTTTITLTGCGLSATITVVQAGQQPYLDVSASSLTVPAGSTSADFSISANCSAWTISESASWLSASPTSGANDRNVELTLSPNNTTVSRSATLTISGCGVTRMVTVSQSGRDPELTVSPSNLNLEFTGGEVNFNISTNCSNWNIGNLPSWATASTISGSEDQTITITYAVNTGQNSRTATITISGCGLNQNLVLTQAGTPVNSPWTVVPTSLNHTLIFPSGLMIDLQGQGLDAGDLIGVFYEDNGTEICSNFTVWSGANTSCAAYGNDAQTGLPKNGFEQGEKFRLKVYRQATDEILDVEGTYAAIGTNGIVSHTDAYANDGISMLTSVELDLVTSLAIPLTEGWNMISSYLLPEVTNMGEVLDPISEQVILLKDEAGQSVIPALGINNVGDWSVVKGYQIKVSAATELTLSGVQADPVSTPIPIRAGWQIISYLRETPGALIENFASLGDNLELVKDNQGRSYIPAFGINTIGTLQPTQGYKLKATTAGTLTYQANFRGPGGTNEGFTSFSPVQLLQNQFFLLDTNLNTGNNCQLVFPTTAVAEQLSVGDEIGLFTMEGVLCGAAVYDGANLAVTAWGDDATTENIQEGMLAGEAYVIKIWRQSENLVYLMNARFSEGDGKYQPDDLEVVESLDVVTSTTEESISGQIRLFPNPAHSFFTVRLLSAGNRLRVRDGMGRIIYQAPFANQRELSISIANWPAGVYLVEAELQNAGKLATRLVVH